jgi:hypothetical protein
VTTETDRKQPTGSTPEYLAAMWADVASVAKDSSQSDVRRYATALATCAKQLAVALEPVVIRGSRYPVAEVTARLDALPDHTLISYIDPDYPDAPVTLEKCPLMNGSFQWFQTGVRNGYFSDHLARHHVDIRIERVGTGR